MATPSASTMNSACKRCRKRKVKCDLQAPRCGNCARAGVTCAGSNLTSSRAACSLPPGFLETLEAEVARLEVLASNAPRDMSISTPVVTVSGGQADATTRRFSQGPDPRPHPARSNFDWSSIGEANSGALHPRLAYGMTRMIQSALAVDNRFPFNSGIQNPLLPLIRNPSTPSCAHPLMPSYLNTYFQSVHTCFPFLDEESIRGLFSRVSPEGATASPALLMSLSLGALLSSAGGPVSGYHAIELFTSAVESSANATSFSDDLETLQFVLLVSLFSLLNPVGGSSWHLVGLAMQLVAALGLHQQRGHDALERGGDGNIGENAFWSAYILDRLISIPLGRPLAIEDFDVSAKLPGDQPPTLGFRILSRLAILSAKSHTNSLSEGPGDTNELQSLLAGVLEHSNQLMKSDTFKIMALTLFTWAVGDVYALKNSLKSIHDGASDRLNVLQSLLVHSDFQTRNNLPLPWTSGYAAFYAAMLLEVSTRFLAIEDPANQNVYTPAVARVPKESIIALLDHCCRTFTGLGDLVPISRQLLGIEGPSMAEPMNLDVIQNDRVRDALSMLVGLTPKSPR